MDSVTKEKEGIQEKILNRAQTLFLRYGIRSVAMNDIAKELGISKKTIYQYFKDKDEIVCLVVEKMWQQDLRDIERITQESEDAIAATVRLSKYFKEMYEHINPSLSYDLKKYHPNAWLIEKRYHENEILNYTRQNLEWGIAEGLYREKINVEVMAIMHIKKMEIICDEKIFPRDQFDLWNLHYEILEHFLRGIVTLKGFQLLETYQSQLELNHENKVSTREE